jgi:hypothetical protein
VIQEPTQRGAHYFLLLYYIENLYCAGNDEDIRQFLEQWPGISGAVEETGLAWSFYAEFI